MFATYSLQMSLLPRGGGGGQIIGLFGMDAMLTSLYFVLSVNAPSEANFQFQDTMGR